MGPQTEWPAAEFLSFDSDRERRSGFTNQQSNRMFVLCPQNAEIRIERPRSFQLSFGLRNRFVGVDAGFIQCLSQFQRLGISLYRRIQQVFESVLPADLE